MSTLGTIAPKLRKAKSDGWAKWIRNDHDERAVANGCYFDEGRARHPYKFFGRYLRHSKGTEWAGKPFIPLDWQWEELLAPMFGWIQPDGFRRIRSVYCEVPKKSGKSTLGSGIGLYMLIGDGEPGAECYSAATTREQAGKVHDEAISMVKASPFLLKRLRINHATKIISHDAAYAKYAAISAEAAGAEGHNIHAAIIDELHVWTNRPFWNALRYGSIARRQALWFVITTAGIYVRTSIGWEEHEYARRWLANEVVNQKYLAYIRCAGDGTNSSIDISDRRLHKEANPSYGTIIDPVEMADEAELAADKPSERSVFLRYRLNVWVESVTTWLDMEKWDACGGAIDLAKLEDRPCYAGLDLALTRDTTALALVFPGSDRHSGIYMVLLFFFIPAENAHEREKRDGVPYLRWQRENHVILTDGNVTDYTFVRMKIRELSGMYDIRKLAYDPYNATQLVNDLVEQDGFPFDRIKEHRQGFISMNAPSKMLERLVLAGRICHGNHPMLRAHASNALIKTDPAGNIKPDKEKSTQRIDGIVATIMAVGLATAGDGKKPSIYETRGLLHA